MPTVDAFSSNPSILSYPRTGKRGVPQQFARRLYEMLQSEAKLALASPDSNAFISWSESGFAFRILDVDGFTSSVLPKYFRTKKFSSFQRNLNLVSTHTVLLVTKDWFVSYDHQSINGIQNSLSRTIFSFSSLVAYCECCSMDLPRSEEVQIQTCTHINLSSGVSLSCS